ncbi:hypothetical protein D3C79_621900 [compost metagenome]
MIQRDIGVNRLAFNIMRNADYRRFGDFRMRDQRRFDFCGAQTVPGNVQHVIDTAGDPVIAIFVTACAVTAEVHAFKGREVGLLEAVMVTVQSSSLAWPRIGDHQVAFGSAFLRGAHIVDQCRLHTKEWASGGASLQLGSSW